MGQGQPRVEASRAKMTVIARERHRNALRLGLFDHDLRRPMGWKITEATIAIDQHADRRLFHHLNIRLIVEHAIPQQARISRHLRCTVAENAA